MPGEPEMIADTTQYIPPTYNRESTLKVSLNAGSNSQNFSLKNPNKSEDKPDNEEVDGEKANAEQ